MKELKSCPFCGGKANGVIFSDGMDEIWIQCDTCPCIMEHDGSEDALIEMWNTRV